MNTNSPADIERDAERVRAEIADTAEHLKAKISPGQLMDEVVDYFKAGDANQFVGNLKRQVRDNPLALGLIGGGLAWLMMGSGTPSLSRPSSSGYRGTGRPTSTDFASTDYDTSSASTLSGSASSRASTGSHSSTSTLDKASGALGASADAVTRTAHDAADSAAAAWGSVRDTASHGLSDASEGLSHAADRVGEAGMRVRRNVVDVLDREPLVLGAIGLAVGAAIAAMLPTTRTEERYLGDASQKAQDRAKDVLSEGYEKAKHVADDAYSAAKAEVKTQIDDKGGDKSATSASSTSSAETTGPKVTSTTSSTPPAPTAPRTFSGS